MTENNDAELPSEPYHTHNLIKKELNFLGDYLQAIENFIIAEGQEEIDTENVSNTSELSIAIQIRISFIMLLFSCFEKNIDRICDAIKKQKKLQINRADLSGGLIKSAKKYLQVFGHFDHSYIEEWATIEGLYDIRNVFVHGGGYIKKANLGSKKRLNNLLIMNIGLTEHKDQISIVDKEFCHYALDSMIKLFKELEVWHKENFVGFWVVK
ncbi:MAG: hypothetical protein ACQ9MH_14780 [Nitrospinales bacterium]